MPKRDSQKLERGLSILEKKLDKFLTLTHQERRRLKEFESDTDEVAADQDLIQEGEAYGMSGVIVEGWGVRYNVTHEGRRQIVNFVLPGSFIGLHANVFTIADHSVATLTACQVAWYDPQLMTQTFKELPRLGTAIAWDAAREEALIAQRLLSLGRRSAYERLAHLIVELSRLLALRDEPLGPDRSFPITQEEFGDTLGLSTVHINRSLKRLRNDGFLESDKHRVVIRDLSGLARVCGYDETYLHKDTISGDVLLNAAQHARS